MITRRTTWLFLCIAVVAGVADVWLLIGWREINPLNLSWLWGDSADGEIGWEFLRHQASWSFPPTWVTRLDYPTGVSASNLDCIPLVAVLLRPFSALLPANFQYLGLYAVCSYVLQAYFGLRLVSLVANGDRLVTVLGAGFFLLAPILTIRLYGHFPLSTQWIILACIYYYFQSPRNGLARYFLPFVAISMLAASIQPYLACMAVLLAFAALWRAWLGTRQVPATAANPSGDHGNPSLPLRITVASCLTWASVLLSGTFAALVVFGFVVFGDSQFAGAGYTDYSLNLLSPFNPGAGGALLFKSLPVIGEGQGFEGYNYLGLGVMLLLAIFIAKKPGAFGALWSPTLRPLTVVSIVFTLLALSVRVTFADHVLFTLPTPKFLFNVLSAFRSSGRFFWPVHYLLILAAVAGIVTAVPSLAARRAILAAALVLQYFDLVPLRDAVAASTFKPRPNPLVSNEWPLAVQQHRHLVILPGMQCGPESSPGGFDAWPHFARLVARSGATLNSAYMGRISLKTQALDCWDTPARLLHDGPKDDTAYVLDDRLAASVALEPHLSHYCRQVDGFNLCTYDPARAAKSPLFADIVAPYYALGTELASEKPSPKSLMLTNVDTGHGWGRWTIGKVVTVDFRLNGNPRQALRLDVEVTNVNATRDHPRQRALVSFNGTSIGRLEFNFAEKHTERSILIPAALARNRLMDEIRLVLPDAIPPRDLGIGLDPRPLAIYIHRLRVVDADSPPLTFSQ